MRMSDRKLEIATFGCIALMVAGLGFVAKAPVESVLQEQDIVYEMPRPKASFLSVLFDLSDREVTRKYVNPFGKKKDQKKVAEQAKMPVAQPKPQKVVQKKAEKKDANEQKKVDVQIVGDDTQTQFTEDNFWAQSAPRVVKNNPAQAKAKDSKDAKQNALSGSQWRALILAQPTSENISKLVDAYQSREVDDDTFYTIVTDLFRDNKVEHQQLGLAALRSVYNEKSFAVTAQYMDSLAPEVQTSAQSYLLSYTGSGRLNILMSALQSSNKETVATAVEVVVNGYKSSKSGATPLTDPRTARGDVNTNSTNNYSKFVPIFRQLAQSPDAMIAGLANSALSEIQVSIAAL